MTFMTSSIKDTSMAYPRIHLSSIPANLRPSIMEKVTALHGVVLDPQHNQYNEQCSHLLVYNDDTKPTERVLAALAAGIWIVRLSWVESSYASGCWVSEEPHECMVSRGLPRYHRLRAKAAMESQDQSCALPSLASNNVPTPVKVKSGGIFSGWTMSVRVKKSADNRSFRRVLGAAGAVVVSSSELAASRDRLNLVLSDHESVGVLRQVLGPCTPIAHHYFLRDVLLQRADPAHIQSYIYPAHSMPNLPRAGSSSQPLVVVDVPSTPTSQKTSCNTPNLSRRPATLRRRNRVTASGAKNASITDYFSPSKSLHRVEEIIVLDDSTSKAPSSRKLFSDVITLSDDEDESHPLKKSRVLLPKAEVKLDDSDGDDIEVVLETTVMHRVKKEEKKGSFKCEVSHIKSEMNDNGKLMKKEPGESCMNGLLPLQPNLANQKMMKFGKSSNGTNSLLSGVKPELSHLLPKKENFKLENKVKVEIVNAITKSLLRHGSSETGSIISSSSSSSCKLAVKQEKLEKSDEDIKENVKQVVNTNDNARENLSILPPAPKVIPAPTSIPERVPILTPAPTQATETLASTASTTSTPTPSITPVTSDTRPAERSTSVSPTNTEQGHSNGKIPHWLTMNMVGKFLETSYSNREILSSSLNRCFPTSIDASLVPFCRVQVNTEASLYWASINQTNLLGINIGAKNTLSVLGSADAKTTSANGSQTAGGGSCEMPNGDSQDRTAAVDENDIEVVINSLLWLRLHMTPLHYPDPEMMGDMLARYVINSGVPHVQSQALCVAHQLLALRPPCQASRPYYLRLLAGAAASVSGKKEVPLSDVTWTLVERVTDALGVTTNLSPLSPTAPRGLTFERWQYEQHLLDFLSFVFSVLDLDISDWRAKAGPAVPVEELVGYRLLFGYSSNPSVLPKASFSLLKLWCRLAPASAQPQSWCKLRMCCSRLVSLMLELVWLYHTQHTAYKPDKKREDLYSGALHDKDSRFSPLAVAISVQFAGMTFGKILNLIRELPLSRHRFFLTNLLRSAYASSISATSLGTASSTLQDLVEALIKECQNCPNTSFPSSLHKSGEPSHGDLTHRDKTWLLFLNILAYVQVTGAAYVVKRAASESLKRKRSGPSHNSDAPDSSASSADSSQRSAENDPSMRGDGCSRGQVFCDGFGKAISKDYLNACCARFSCDRKLLTAKQSTFLCLLRSCEHIFMLKLLLYLLYFKV